MNSLIAISFENIFFLNCENVKPIIVNWMFNIKEQILEFLSKDLF